MQNNTNMMMQMMMMQSLDLGGRCVASRMC